MNWLTHDTAHPRQAGFSLLEALVTMVVVSAGLFGLAGLQATLTREVDTSHQRGEATRLAQERIETFRSFHQIESVKESDRNLDDWGRFGWNDLPKTGSDTITNDRNINYVRTWSLSGKQTDTWRVVHVTVTWMDRADVVHDVLLNSVIAKAEPAISGNWASSSAISGPTHTKPIGNRHLNIPYPAVDLGNGQSVYRISSTATQNYSIVFDHSQDIIVKQCYTASDVVITTSAQADDASLCQSSVKAYLVTGYISLMRSDDSEATGITPPWPKGLIVMQSIGIVDADVKCTMGPAIDQSNSASSIVGYKHYLCVLPLSPGSTAWGGMVYLSDLVAADARVCRYQFKTPGLTDDERNEQPYDDVKVSLHNQNYVVAPAGVGQCPTLISAQDLLTATLEPHQDCTTNSLHLATQCPELPTL